MKFNLVAPKEKPCLKVCDISNFQWFAIDNLHFIRMGIHDGEICCYGTLVRDNCKVYNKDFRVDDDEYDCIACFNLEEQMLVYISKYIEVDDYGDYEMNLFRK